MKRGILSNLKPFFIFSFGIISIFLFRGIALSESITLTTYYPSPFGVYQSIRLYPQNVNPTTGPFTCDSTTEGSLYYNSTDGQVYVCSGGTWGSNWTNVGWWRSDDGINIYNTNTGVVRIRDNAAPYDLIVEGRTHFTKTGGGTEVEVDGTVHASGGDLAEFILADSDVESGDVVVIDEITGKAKKAHQAYSDKVAGIISADPGLLIGKGSKEEGHELLVLTGQVPCKATAINGAIRPGDFLVSSSNPGYAMKATFLSVDDVRTVSDVKKVLEHNQKIQMSVIGKALEPLENGEGRIAVLVK